MDYNKSSINLNMKDFKMETLYKTTLPFAACGVVLILIGHLLIGADSNTSDKNNKSNQTYEVVCKHPMGHVLKYKVDSHQWGNLYNSRNSIWRFSDIKGNVVKTSGPCFTDNQKSNER